MSEVDTARALGPLAAHLAGVVAASTRQKLPLDEVYRAAVAFDRSLASAVGARAELAGALHELEAAGVVVLPRGAAHFDRRSAPPLPAWIRRSQLARRAAAPPPARVWPSVLQAAAAIARRPEEIAVLDAVAGFLRRGGAQRISVPTRERSLELFDDEKRLDALIGSRLFTSGALTLSLLRCHPVPMPFAAQWIPGAAAPSGPLPGEVLLLVAENHHTYASLLEAARRHAADGGRGLHVGYGGGQQFCSAVAAVTLLQPAPTRIVYFGDLDRRGLEIPATASATARAAGLPPVTPALPLYAALLRHGHPARAAAVPADVAAATAAWLGPHADAAAVVLTGGHRLAQEAVGLELLLAHPEWLAAA